MSADRARSLPLLTARLRLRELRTDDLADMQRLYRDPRVAALVGAHEAGEVEEELRFDIDHQAREGWAMWAVEERQGAGRFIGACGLRPLEMRGPEIELGYDLLPEFWGRGFASEAARAAVDYALDDLGLDRVVAVVKPTHMASRRVLEKAGLALVGQVRAYDEDLLHYQTRTGAGERQ